MQILLDIQQEKDLQVLLPLLERLGIAYQWQTPARKTRKQEGEEPNKAAGQLPETAELPTQDAGAFIPLATVKALYPDEWVLLANVEKRGMDLIGGQVVLHEKDKRTFALKAKALIQENKGLTHFFTGEPTRYGHIGLARKVSK